MKMKTKSLLSFFLSAALLAGGASAVSAEETVQEKSNVCYEVFVYSFYDSDGDGIGDLKGLLQKLDYINDGDPETGEDLGCDMVWLMPVFPSPTYHKYDATDYCAVDPQYGTLEDLDSLIAGCHKRGVRLILDVAFNHTSTEHPWFLAAADYLRSLGAGEEPSADACPYVDYYVFSRARKTGYEPREGTDWFYEARFWSGMPDLNLDSEAVRGEIAAVTAFWQERGVDGFRLDAVTSYYTEDGQASIDFVRWLTDTVKTYDADAYLVAEAWTNMDTYAEYYTSGIDSMFDFAFADAEGYIAKVVKGRKDASYYGKQLAAEEKLFSGLNENYINAPFYTNHDMARSAGYYNRDDGSRTKLAQGLNLLMPGNAFLYYGEELGMKGSGRDENKRAPMYWTEDADAEGMCSGPPEMENVKMKFPAADEQSADAYSILSYVREAIRIRRDYPVIAEGTTKLIKALSGKTICAITRKTGDADKLLLIINTSEETQEVDLSQADTGCGVLADMLLTGEEKAELEGEVLKLPAFGIAVLTQE